MKEYNHSFYAYLGAVFSIAIILVFGLFSAFQPGRMVASAKALEAEAVERGAEVYHEDCATCHGERGEGVRNSGPALNTKEFLTEALDGLIFNTIADGRPGTSMPAWGQARGGPYNAQVLEDLVIFIRAWEPTAPSVEEIAYIGDPVEGAVLFSTTCFACHGVSGEGTAAGLRLNDSDLLEKYDDEYFRDVIGRGRPERGMPTWGSVLSPMQIEDLVAYIRSWESEAPLVMADLGGDSARGEAIFASTCTVCHGPGGNGTDTAPRLAEASILDDPELLYLTISQGRLQNGMPNWGQVLAPAEINDVVAYLKTLRAAPIAAAGEGSVANGAKLYNDACVTCHGLSGEGVEDLGPILRPSDIVAASDDTILVDLILTGHGEMPGQADLLSEQEVNDLIALLRNWQGSDTPPEPAEEEIEISTATQFIYLQQCATCHGLSGEGTEDRPALINNEFIQNSNDEAILNMIANGKANTPMEGFSNELSEEEMRSLIPLLRGWQ